MEGRRPGWAVIVTWMLVISLLQLAPGDPAAASGRASKQWAMAGGTAQHDGRNHGERRLSPRNVHRLRLDWRRAVGGDETPVVVGRRIYTTCGRGGLCALRRRTGRVLWHLEGDIGAGTAVVARPAYTNGVVVATFGYHPLRLVGVRPDTGRIIWRTTIPDASQTTSWPTAHNGTVYVGANDGYVYAIAAATGKRRWRSSGQLASTPAIGGGKVFVNAGESGSGPYLRVYDKDTGEEAWHAGESGGAELSPTVIGDRVVIRTSDGYLRAWDVGGCGRRLCKPVWSVAAGIDDHGRVGRLAAGPRNLFVDSDDRLVAIDATTGKRRWESERAVENLGAPTIANGVVYVADGLFVRAFRGGGCGNPVCQPLWERRLSRYSFSRRSRVVVAYGSVFVVDHDNRLQKFSLP